MVDMYAKCGSLAKAQEVFDQLPVRDIVSWNALITGYTEHGLSEEVLHYLERMQLEGISPDAVTFVCSLKACGNIGALLRGQELHAEIAEHGFEKDPFVTSILVDMYARCGSLSEAQEVFDELQDRGVVVWTVLIRGYAEHGLGEEALNCLKEMELEGVLPNDVTMLCSVKACGNTRAIDTGRSIHAKIIKKGFEKNHFVDNSLVDMYVKCGSLVEARKVFDKLSVRDVVSWTALIAGYTEQGLGQEALKCLKQMQVEGMPLDAGIYVCCLKACGNIRDINRGQELHAEVAEEGFEGDQNVGSSLVVMYAKCNSLAEAQDVFDELQDRDVVSWNALATGCAEHGLGEDVQDCFKKMQQDGIAPDVVSWNALVLGYAEQGDSEKALISYAQMQEQGFPPNVMIFLGILKACGNAAALQSGKKMQAQICGVDDTEVVLATALVDMYGKCGRMVDAQKVFDGVSMRVLVGYNALIMGYARHGDSEPVFSLFEKMREEGVQPDAVTFLSILTVCNHAGLPDNGHKCFEDMNKKFDITPTIKHYTCMLDLLGRTGQLDEAVVMVDKTPFEHDFVLWCTMLGACQVWGNTELGRWAFDCAASSGEQEALEFILMSNIYADARI